MVKIFIQDRDSVKRNLLRFIEKMEQALRIHVYIEIFNSSNKNMHFERLSFKQKSKKRKKKHQKRKQNKNH